MNHQVHKFEQDICIFISIYIFFFLQIYFRKQKKNKRKSHTKSQNWSLPKPIETSHQISTTRAQAIIIIIIWSANHVQRRRRRASSDGVEGAISERSHLPEASFLFLPQARRQPSAAAASAEARSSEEIRSRGC